MFGNGAPYPLRASSVQMHVKGFNSHTVRSNESADRVQG